MPLRPDAERDVDEYGRRYRRKQLIVAEIALKEVKEKESSMTGLLTEVEEKIEECKLHPGSHDHMDCHRPESDSRVLNKGDVSEA